MGNLQPQLGKRINLKRETLKGSLKARGDSRWRHWTQQAVADLMDVKLETYQRWEYGDAEPDIGTIVRLAKLLGEDAAALLGLSSSPSAAAEPLSMDAVLAYIKGLEEANKQSQARLVESERAAEQIERARIEQVAELKERIKSLEEQLKLAHYDKSHEKFRRGDPREDGRRGGSGNAK